MNTQNGNCTKIWRAALLLFIVAVSLYGEITVHVQNPWRNDATGNNLMNMVGAVPELGNTTYPGDSKPMMGEGNNWFKFIFTSSQKNSTADIQIVKPFPAQNWNWKGKSIGSLSSLFQTSTNKQIDVWVLFDLTGKMTVTLDPKVAGATTLILLNPFPESSPKMLIGTSVVQMNLSDAHQGWYQAYYMGDRNNFTISFRDYFTSQWFNSDGGKKTDNTAAPIDLTPYKDSGNVLYIWPQPAPAGKPKVSSKFPGILGDASTRKITALVRDQKAKSYGGEFEGGFDNELAIKGMVKTDLTAKWKIQKDAKEYFSDSLESWFENRITPNSKTNDTCIHIELKKSNDGGWSFNSDETGGFYPVDNFNPWGDWKKLDDHDVERNFGFTMELRTEFDYHEGRGQTFYFSGDDDVWVFVNGKLVIDLGGAHQALADSINLDDLKTKLGLVDGKVYRLDMFYCERQSNSSNFRMRTTLNIDNSNSLILDTITDGKVTHIIVKEIIVGEFGNKCGMNISDPDEIDTATAKVNFTLYGDQFPNTGSALTNNSVNWGGIKIQGDSAVIIDTSIMTGLALGKYQIIGVNSKFFSTQPITFVITGKSTFSVDTASVKVNPIPEEIHYKSSSLDVNLVTDNDCKIFYTMAGNSGSFDGQGKITVSADSVTVTVYSEGSTNPYKLKSDERKYLFIRDLPQSYLYSNGKVGANSLSSATIETFTTPKLSVELLLKDKDGTTIDLSKHKGKITYARNNKNPSTDGTTYSGTFEIGSSDTIRAIATLDGYSYPLEGFWIYHQKLPPAYLIAMPGVSTPNSYKFNTATLDVRFAVVSNGDTLYPSDSVSIWYEKHNGDPTAKKNKFANGDKITINSDDTLRAFAELTFTNSINGTWYYDQKFDVAKLEATPGSTNSKTPHEYDKGSMKVTLSTNTGGTIHYSIASLGGKSSDFSRTIFEKGEVTISGNDTIWAFADGAILDRFDSVWVYQSNLPPTDLEARANSETVSSTNRYLFGHTLQVELISNAVDTIHFTSDGSDVDKSDSLYNDRDKIQIRKNDRDTIVINGLAYDKDHQSIKKSWKFVRDTLPRVLFSISGQKISGKTDITLSLDQNANNGWKDLEIWYTTDGTDPDKDANKGQKFDNSGTVSIDTTKEIRARAYASNRVESPIRKEFYRLVAGSREAWYFDKNGDGQIDNAHIILTKDVSDKPQKIELKSPFDSSDSITVTADKIELQNGRHLIVTIDKQFKFTNSTSFATAVYGKIHGDEYSDNGEIRLGDSVAPVMVNAVYSPGKIKEITPNVIRHDDTLSVLFSENVSIVNKDEPFEIRSAKGTFTLRLKDASLNGSSARFLVNESDRTKIPNDGDKIHINPSAGVAGVSKEVQNHRENRWITLKVNEIPHQLLIRAISPVNPDEEKIPEALLPKEFKSNKGLVILADFLVPIKRTEGIQGAAKIFDMLGNVVAYTGQIGGGEHLVAELRSTNETTRVQFYWDGKNSSGRRVGAGSYLAVVTITDHLGQTSTEKLQIGIKK